MNILIVSQRFKRGGLETNIYTQYNQMKKNNKFFMAVGEDYTSNLDFSDCEIYKNFNFLPDSTIEEFCNDVDRLVNIIKTEKIELIHVHPFYSLFPAIFAAKITNTPVVYTVHGLSSATFPHMVNDVILHQCMLEGEIDKIFVVSNLCVNIVNNSIGSNKTILLPNAIDNKKYSRHKIANNKVWALISRITPDKIKEIKEFLSILDKIDICKICIYGDGECKEDLQKFIDDNNLTNKVEMLGHFDNLYEELNNKYNGIIGIGRVALESICMEYPTLLIGYGKISGIIDEKMYNSIKDNNFINKMVSNIDVDKLNMQLKMVYDKKLNTERLRNKLIKQFSAKKVYEYYSNEISKIERCDIYNINKIYEEICNIKDKKQEFYKSRVIYNILKIYIERECITINLKNYFVIFNSYFDALDIDYRYRLGLQENIENLKK